MTSLLESLFPWFKALGPGDQIGIETFTLIFLLFTWLMIRYRIKLYRQGIYTLPRSKSNTPLTMLGGAALFIVGKYTTAGAAIMSWPDRFDCWREHSGVMLFSLLAAGLCARMVSGAYAALFLRAPSGNGNSYVGVAVNPQPRRYTGVWWEL